MLEMGVIQSWRWAFWPILQASRMPALEHHCRWQRSGLGF